MRIKSNILEATGNTPLVRLNKVVSPEDATVLVKCEYMNPSGSIKERMAAYMIKKAEETGQLKPGGTIVENTSGNTGIALAMIAAVKGYRCVVTMPDKMSQEKVDTLRALGAEVVITPTEVPTDSPLHYVETAKRIARETPNSYYLDQYHNSVNNEAHYHLTGPEIWEDTEGQLDYIVAATGTGGTLSGTGRFLKEKKPSIKVVGIDAIGSIHYDYFYTQKIVPSSPYKVEGIGKNFVCGALDFATIDEMYQTNDEQAFTMARRLLKEEGLLCGGSSGSIVYAAVELAKKVGKGKIIVAILPDSSGRYTSKFISDAWMKQAGFL